jgi:hypothetical protein
VRKFSFDNYGKKIKINGYVVIQLIKILEIDAHLFPIVPIVG